METETESTGLAVINVLKPMDVFESKEKADSVLDQLEKLVKNFVPDASTEQGRKEIASFDYALARSKKTLDKMGLTLTEEWRDKTKTVNETRKRFNQTIEAWQRDVTKDLDTWKATEKMRTQAHEDRLQTMFALDQDTDELTSTQIENRIQDVSGLVDTDWQEFYKRGTSMYETVLANLTRKLNAKVKAEEQQAELERFRQAENARIEAERQAQAQREAEEKTRRDAEAAEKLRLEAEERGRQQAAAEAEAKMKKADEDRMKAEEDARLSDQRARDAETARLDAEERAKEAAQKAEAEKSRQIQEEREKAKQEARIAVENERKRQEEDAKRREANKAHRAKINNGAKAALIALEVGLSDEQCRDIISAIAHKKIPHIHITY